MTHSTTTAKGELAIISILLSAEKQFLSHGYNGTSMRDIAEGAGYRSVAGIYNHFREKEDILVALIQARSHFDSLTSLIESAQGETFASFWANCFALTTDFISHNLGFVQLILIDYFEFKGKHLVSLLPAQERLMQMTIQRLEALPDLPAQVSTSMLLKILQAQVIGYVFTQALNPPAWADQGAWQTTLIEVIVNGLATKDSAL